MSWALCFNCGEIKFGALCECEQCGIASSGNVDLDILFSDWNMTESTMKKFGDVIKTINQENHNKEICFWSFLAFVSKEYLEILNIDISNNIQTEVSDLLEKLNLERFEIL